MGIIIEGDTITPRKEKKKIRPIRNTRRVEVEYRKSLNRLIGSFKNEVFILNDMVRGQADPEAGWLR